MSVRAMLPLILRGEEITDLSPASRERLEQLAIDAQSSRETVWVRDECAGRLKQAGAPHTVEYMLAAACRMNGETERAHQTCLSLGDKLAAEKKWEPLAAVAEHALEIEHSQAAARLLVKAHEGLKKDPARIDALQRAFAILPTDLELGLLLAVRLGEVGQAEERRMMLAEMLPRFAAEGRSSGLEEVALEFVEHEDIEGAIRMVQTLPQVQGDKAAKEVRALLDISFPLVVTGGRAGECLAALRQLAQQTHEAKGAIAAEAFRAAIVEAIRQGPGKTLPNGDAVITLSGIADELKPMNAALDRFDAIAALPPGAAVYHTGFGAGRVTSDDGETVVIDFARSKGHKMPFTAARRTLTPITDDDLRLMSALEPAKLKALVTAQPTEVMCRALKALGGAADAQKLKVFLVGSSIVPATEWTVFWRKARGGAEKDPRIDGTRAFEQHYRLAEDADDIDPSVPLPAFEVRKPIRTNLGTLRKFLSQHPDMEFALAKRFGRYVARAVLDAEGDPTDRARAGLYFSRWYPDHKEEWITVLKTLWEQGLAVSDMSGEDDQLSLLDVSHAAGVEADAILSGLDSRFATVRQRAMDLRTHLDDAGRAALRNTLLQHAPRYPGASIRLIEEEMGPDVPSDERWKMFRAALALIEFSPKPSLAEKVLRWLEPQDLFDTSLDGTVCPGPVRLELRVLMRQWRSSDRFLFPCIEAVERLGLADEAEAVRETRQKNSEKLFANVGQQSEDAHIVVMTRATWQRLKEEMERLERELRTTIPKSIQKARELGDLKENAEYHSAKLKQANVSKLVRSMQLRLTRARFVEELEFKKGIVGVGMEVELQSDQKDSLRYWILGEEEHHLGAHVISFQAPVGRALLGLKVGDELDLGDGDERRHYRVVSVERRIPPASEVEAS